MWGYKDDFSDITEFKHHVKLYSLEENLHRLDFVFSDTSKIPLSNYSSLEKKTRKDDLAICLGMIKQKGFDVVVIDVTSPDIRDIGYSVIKVLIPGMQPLNGDHNYPFWGGRRLCQMPVNMGITTTVTKFENLNRDPHPFP